MKKSVIHGVLFGCGCTLVALAVWPLVTLVNRVQPFIFGLPPFVFSMLVLNLLVALLLFIACKLAS